MILAVVLRSAIKRHQMCGELYKLTDVQFLWAQVCREIQGVEDSVELCPGNSELWRSKEVGTQGFTSVHKGAFNDMEKKCFVAAGPG